MLTARQRAALFALPGDHTLLSQHCVFSGADLAAIRRRRRSRNRLGFALQLCAFRWPGRLIDPGEDIPDAMLAFVAEQIGASADDIAHYAARDVTRYQHSAALQQIFGFRPFEGQARREICTWLTIRAGEAPANVRLVEDFLAECRTRRVIVPGPPLIERLCADALVAAEEAAITMIAGRLHLRHRSRLMTLLEESGEANESRFIWVRRLEAGGNSADMHRLLDRLETIEGLDLPDTLLENVPRAQFDRLCGQGARLFTTPLRRLRPERRFAILAVCLLAWRAKVTDALIDTNDRILGKIWREAARQRDELVQEARLSASETLNGLGRIGRQILVQRDDTPEPDLSEIDWEHFAALVTRAESLTGRLATDPIDHVALGHPRLRRYMRRFLGSLDWAGAKAVGQLLAAVRIAMEADRGQALPTGFLARKWRDKVRAAAGDRPFWEVALMFGLRNALRSGDVWVQYSTRYAEIERQLLSVEQAQSMELAVPLDPESWLADRRQAIDTRLAALEDAARAGQIPNAEFMGGKLVLHRQGSAVPDEAEALVTEIYNRMPSISITDLMMAVDDATGFTDAFSDLRKGSPPVDRRALLSVLLADGINIGLKKMADACQELSYWELVRAATWHVRPETYDRALAILVDVQSVLPFAANWGRGQTASSDGQHFRAGATGEAMNVVNAKYGSQPGMFAYTHVSDQYAPFHVQRIGATAHEAPFVLDGLLLHDSGLKITEQFTDTGGFTDHVFAACSFLGCRFAPRIRGLADHKLYLFDPDACPELLRPMIGGKINEKIIRDAWPDMIRATASMKARTIVPSQYLRKLSAYPKRNALARAWREVGRIERTIFVLDWLLDDALQRRVQVGLNKGESHHALKDAIHFHRKGEIRDRTRESQEMRIAGMNLLAAIIIFWNTAHLGDIVDAMKTDGYDVPDELLRHVTPLGWEHIILTGRYSWESTTEERQS